jgi:hypothetical protein
MITDRYSSLRTVSLPLRHKFLVARAGDVGDGYMNAHGDGTADEEEDGGCQKKRKRRNGSSCAKDCAQSDHDKKKTMAKNVKRGWGLHAGQRIPPGYVQQRDSLLWPSLC